MDAQTITVKIRSESGILPEYKTSGASGMDIRAHLEEEITLLPGKRALISTGLFIELPCGYEAQVRARSGLAMRYGVGLVNGIGTIDSDYRGEIKVALMNFGEEAVTICNGDRIAQMVVCALVKVTFQQSDILSETKRNDGGFGHTGI